ncbi:MAG TPA: c-type cytochrome [Chitinophagales bacterium]|nr:c-type cytochrome [Chitinophagales bacterium]
MKTVLTFLFLTISVSLFGQAGRNGTNLYYKSGELQMESKYDSICNCEKETEYFESGKIRSTKRYLHNGSFDAQSDVEEITYFENGTIRIYSYWKDNALNGRIYSNFADGKLAGEHFYANKFKTGTWKSYNQDGTLREEKIFEENKTPWDSNDDYAKDKFYFNNKLAYSIELVAGRKTDTIIFDNDSYNKLIASEPSLGKKLFLQNCSQCHTANHAIVGPMMTGVTERRTIEWLTKMIANGDALIKDGDKDAVALYKKYNNIHHPNFERLSSEEVTAIIDFLRTLK